MSAVTPFSISVPSAGLDKYHHRLKNGGKRNLTEMVVATILYWSKKAGIMPESAGVVSMKMTSRARQSLASAPLNSQ